MHEQAATPLIDHASALHERGVAAFQAGDIEVALTLLPQACAQPGAPGIYHRSHCEVLRRCGRVDEAVAAARRAVRCDPDRAEAWQSLGTVLAEGGALEESRDCFAAAIAIAPGYVPAYGNLAVVLQQLGKLRAAEACYRDVLRLAPDNLDVWLNFAALLAERGRHREGLAIVARVLDRSPRMVRALLIASELERDLGRHAAALDFVERALAVTPDDLSSLVRRARILCRLGRAEEALEDCNRVLAVVENDAEARHAQALALQELDRPAAAIEAFRVAEAASAMPAPIITDQAWLLAELGHRDDALAALGRALALEPNLAAAWYYRASLSGYAPGDRDLAIMAELADDPDAPHRSRLCLSFALGRAYLDCGDGARAFARLDEGNRLQRAMIDYDPEADARRFAEIAAIFSADTLWRRAGEGNPSDRPIFVFGMPRSGTTLIEQILAAHPLVRGTGEPTALRDIAEAPGFPARVPDLAPDQLGALGGRYLQRIGADGDGERTIDKMPSNFMHAGLISLILPGARMIHCRRDALDTCLSCYSLLFANGQDYSYDLRELGLFYRLYTTLMVHWRRVLPPESFIEIDYETLVHDTEGEVRRMLDFCRLPWNASCLRFYEAQGRVTSASLMQVRSPVYTKSIGRARSFRRWLGTLEAALADTATDIAAAC